MFYDLTHIAYWLDIVAVPQVLFNVDNCTIEIKNGYLYTLFKMIYCYMSLFTPLKSSEKSLFLR